MNAHREEPAAKKRLMDSLLAIDSQMPDSTAEGRQVAKEILRRDRRRVRILTRLTVGLFLLAVIGICLSVYWYYIKVVPTIYYQQQALAELGQEIAKEEPQPSKPGPLARTALFAATQCHILYVIQLVNLGGIVVLFAVMLAAAFCTVLLIMATRRATLRQIQASLLALSEQLDALQRSTNGSRSTGGHATEDRDA